MRRVRGASTLSAVIRIGPAGTGDDDRFARFRLIGWWDQERLAEARVLLIGGTTSPSYLGAALRELAAVLPRAQAVTLPRLGHTGPQNDGKPEVVARALREFFTAA